jgi:NHL repeat
MRAYKATCLIALAVVALFAVFAATAGSAAAFTGYGLPSFFGAAGSGAGQFAEPAGVAVNDSSGDVYVYDSGNLRVQWLDAAGSKVEGELDGSVSPSGRFAPPASISEYAAHGTLFNLAVDNDPSSPSGGDVYVVDPGHNVIDKFTPSGTYLSQLVGFKATVFGVAVDSSGHVWVSEEGSEASGKGLVQEYSSALVNVHLGEMSLEFPRSPGIAVDSAGSLYLPRGGQDIAKFGSSGSVIEEAVTTCGCVTALAADPGNNDLFADQGSLIARYGPFGEPYREAIEPLEGISGSVGVAVNGTTHTVYASQREANTVAVFKFGAFPDVTTGPASEQTRTTAKVEGEVNPDGMQVTSCQFEYGASTAYGKVAPCATLPGSGTSPVVATADLTGLSALDTYHYRLVAASAGGPRAGADQEFTTPAVENVKTEGAGAVTATDATVAGSLEPNGFDTHYFFEYHQPGATAASTPAGDAGSVSEDVQLSAGLANLEPRTTYLYRLVGENQFGQTIGGERAFTTPALAPTIEGAPNASFVASQSADVSAALNPENTRTYYHFEYGPCASLAGCAEIKSTTQEASAAYGRTPTTAEISELAAATTYSYRLVASNRYIASCEGGYPVEEEGVIVRCEEGGAPVYAGGEATGPEGAFTTAPGTVVQATTGASSAVAATSTVISGTVDPDGQPVTYAFELGVYAGAATQYGVVSSGSAGAAAGAIEESLSLSGLQPGVTYAYRIAVHSGYILNPEQTLYGTAATFTTSGLPTLLSAPTTPALLAIPGIRFPTTSHSKPRKTHYRRSRTKHRERRKQRKHR